MLEIEVVKMGPLSNLNIVSDHQARSIFVPGTASGLGQESGEELGIEETP